MTGAELRAWRETRNMTQTAVGEILGRQRGTIGRWEATNATLPWWAPELLADYDKRHGLITVPVLLPAATAEAVRWRGDAWAAEVLQAAHEAACLHGGLTRPKHEDDEA